MTQYINKDVLVAEIKNLIDRCNIKKRSCPVNTQVEAICDNKIYAYKEILSLLDILKVKEVDLDTVMEEEYDKYRCYNSNGSTLVTLNILQFNSIAKHFFELGIKEAQKGE